MQLHLVYLLSSAINIALVATYSTGVFPSCDAFADFGCDPSKYVNGDHLVCNDTLKSPMPWASRPTRNSAYSVRTSDTVFDALTPYTPGKFIAIHVRTAPKMKFRGSNVLQKVILKFHKLASYPELRIYRTSVKCCERDKPDRWELEAFQRS